VKVNGNKIDECELNDNDEIIIGKTKMIFKKI